MKRWKYKKSIGDYEVNPHPRTFSNEFYYINYIDKSGKFDSSYSEKIDDRTHAFNRARWILKNKWYLNNIPYIVVKIGVYSSTQGHVKLYSIN